MDTTTNPDDSQQPTQQPLDPIEIIARREALGLSQADLADHLDIKQLTISRWETGARYPRDDTFLREALDTLEAFTADLAAELWAELTAQHAALADGERTLTLVTFADAESWRQRLPSSAPRLPVRVHHRLVGMLRAEAAEHFGLEVRIVTAD